MTYFEQYFDGHLFCINLARRKDRWDHALKQFEKFGLTQVQRFEACEDPDRERKDQNTGCTLSHRTLLDMQIENGWPRMFVFEDDFDLIYEDFHERFEQYVKEVPADWDFLFIGGGYGAKPLARVSPHVFRASRLMTTSSYGVTLDCAKRLAPDIVGSGPIDILYSDRQAALKTYILSPRLCVQYTSHSDLMGKTTNNAFSMLDRRLEEGL